MATFTKHYQPNIAAGFPQFKFAKSFQRIHFLLNTEGKVSEHLTELNRQIGQRVQDNKADTSYTASQALYDILRECEDLGGFDKTQVKYVTGVLKADEFRAMMTGCVAFLDPFVTPRHGAETHRIQWWMISRDMAANASEYDANVTPAQLFASTNDPTAIKGDNNNVWYICLDASQGACDSGCAPESLKEYILAKFPNVASAEASQMKWDTCTKARYSVIKGLPAVARMKAQELVQYPKP
jgi:hypothetical protein